MGIVIVMRIKKDVITQNLLFIGVDSTDHISRKTGLSSFTVYYSLNGGTPALVSSPTIFELDDTNMAGDYILTIDEVGMVSGEGELTLHVTASGMDPVTRIVEISDNLDPSDEIIADAVWANADGVLVASGIETISSIEAGRWKIESNQMIFYEEDNVTEIMRFNLFDEAGDPANTDIFDRQRV